MKNKRKNNTYLTSIANFFKRQAEEKEIKHEYVALTDNTLCNVCEQPNTEFIEYFEKQCVLLRVCQSCVSRQFRLFSKEIKSYKNK